MIALQRAGRLVAASAALFLAACGGSGDSAAGAPSPSPDPTPAAVAFAAVGSSAHTASLAWARPAGAAAWAVERQAGGGAWVEIARVDAREGVFLDAGLAPDTAYAYRLREGAATLAEHATRTGTEVPVSTARGAAAGETATLTIGAAGGRLASADGTITVDVPAGAFAAAGSASAQPVANTAPGGLGAGLTLRLPARPAAPLALTLRYGADDDRHADAMRIAAQRPDGSWISLPLAAQDKAARTLAAELPPSFFAPAGASAQAIEIVEFTIVRYLAFHLEPRQALVKVSTSIDLVPHARVRGYDALVGTCVSFPEFEACVMQPVMETREIPFTNAKAGFERRWLVFDDEGGKPGFGSVAPRGAVGATYTAPARVPDPSTVPVSFVSRHLATGRTVFLTSAMAIWDDRWSGEMRAVTPPSYAGTVFTAIARVAWNLDAAASSATRKVYRPEGTLDVIVTDDDCTVTITPMSQPVATDTRLVELAVDESTSPPTYTARLITFWSADISGVCPKGSATVGTLAAGYGWEVQGTVSGDGTRIEGAADSEGTALSWSFQR